MQSGETAWYLSGEQPASTLCKWAILKINLLCQQERKAEIRESKEETQDTQKEGAKSEYKIFS